MMAEIVSIGSEEIDFNYQGEQFASYLSSDREERLEQLIGFFEGAEMHEDVSIVIRAAQQAKAEHASMAADNRNAVMTADREARKEARRSKNAVKSGIFSKYKSTG